MIFWTWSCHRIKKWKYEFAAASAALAAELLKFVVLWRRGMLLKIYEKKIQLYIKGMNKIKINNSTTMC